MTVSVRIVLIVAVTISVRIVIVAVTMSVRIVLIAAVTMSVRIILIPAVTMSARIVTVVASLALVIWRCAARVPAWMADVVPLAVGRKGATVAVPVTGRREGRGC